MRRPVWMLAGVVVLSLLPVTVSGCGITCACAATPDPNWTPQPITAQQAAFYAAKVAGRASGTIDNPSMTAIPMNGPNGRAFYQATAPDFLALVDSTSGSVVEVVLEDQLPSDATVSASASDARTSAEAFMQRGGNLEGLSESAQVVRQADLAAYRVDWKDSGETQAATFSVWVNASTGSVFAFVDLRMQLNLTPPIVGRDRATKLAIAALGIPGETATSVDLAITFPLTGSQQSLWEVAFGVPTATQTDVFEHGALVSVDAVTGEAMIVKS